MKIRQRLIVDSNALISSLLDPRSVPGRVVRRVLEDEQLLVSEATMLELVEVLSRQKFDRYVTIEERQEFLRRLARLSEFVSILRPVRGCRDVKDDKFLELAVNGDAVAILTGDADLLELNPFHGIAILTPAQWLREQEK